MQHICGGRHVADVTQLSDSEAGKYWEDVTRVARAVELHFTPAKLNLETLGNEVPHLHTHVVPRRKGDGLRGFLWPRTKYESDAERETYAARIAAALR